MFGSILFFPIGSSRPCAHIQSLGIRGTLSSKKFPTTRWYSIDKFRCWSTRSWRGWAIGPFSAFLSCIPNRAKQLEQVNAQLRLTPLRCRTSPFNYRDFSDVALSQLFSTAFQMATHLSLFAHEPCNWSPYQCIFRGTR